jgi:nascent polypeptide-associated complex subunit alpha
MIPGMNPRQMRQVMKRLGIQQEDIPAKEVIIKTDDKEIVISNPQVAKVNMMGQPTWQVMGDAQERAISTEPDISEEDVKTVMEQAGCSKDEAEKAIKEAKGDLAEAILKLKED